MEPEVGEGRREQTRLAGQQVVEHERGVVPGERLVHIVVQPALVAKLDSIK
jgi:hypothetical protein